jgi:hypothetical protein
MVPPAPKILAQLNKSGEGRAATQKVVRAAARVADANGRNDHWHPEMCIERSGRFGEDEKIKCICGLDELRHALAELVKVAKRATELPKTVGL